MKNYLAALRLYIELNGEKHAHIGMLYQRLAKLYGLENDMLMALTFQKKANEIFRKTLPKRHPMIKQGEKNLRIYSSLS